MTAVCCWPPPPPPPPPPQAPSAAQSASASSARAKWKPWVMRMMSFSGARKRGLADVRSRDAGRDRVRQERRTAPAARQLHDADLEPGLDERRDVVVDAVRAQRLVVVRGVAA